MVGISKGILGTLSAAEAAAGAVPQNVNFGGVGGYGGDLPWQQQHRRPGKLPEAASWNLSRLRKSPRSLPCKSRAIEVRNARATARLRHAAQAAGDAL